MVSCEGQVEPLESGLEYTVAGRGPRELTVLVKTAQIYSQLKVYFIILYSKIDTNITRSQVQPMHNSLG